MYRDCRGVSTMVRYNRRKACAKKVGVLQRTCKIGKVLVCAAAVAVVPTLRGQPFIKGCYPSDVPFGTPKGTEKGPATSDSARLAAHNERRHPAKRARSCASKPHWGFDRCATAQQPGPGARPLGIPKRRSKKQKAKTCRSAARFLTLFTSSPIDPSGAKFHSTTHSVGADACHRPAPAGTYLRAGRRGGFHIRPQYTRNHRGVGDAAPYTQPYGACRGEHCSPLRSLCR